MLMLSTFGREYGKLCEIKSAVDLRFYEANHTSLAKFFKSLVSRLVESHGRHASLDRFNHVKHHKGYGALWWVSENMFRRTVFKAARIDSEKKSGRRD